MHKSGLKPLGVAILVESYDPGLSSTKLIIPESVAKGQKALENRAIVVEIGELAWKDEPNPRAKVGDKVLLANYCGVLVTGPKDGKVYRMVNDRDIYCQFEEKEDGA